jgi:hypothetical protein
MQCREFENRLNAVLDERRWPATDPLLAAHAMHCDECRQLLSLQAALIDGLSRRNLPPLPRDFAGRVVAAAGRDDAPVLVARQRTSRAWLAIGAMLASAAMMLLAVSLVRIARRGDRMAVEHGNRESALVGKGPRQPSRLAAVQPGVGRRMGALEQPGAISGADWLIEAPRLPNRLREYRGAIDELVVSLPEAASRLHEVEQVAPGIRPLRATFSTIWETLSLTIPAAGTKPGPGETPSDSPGVSGSSLLPAERRAVAVGSYSFCC